MLQHTTELRCTLWSTLDPNWATYLSTIFEMSEHRTNRHPICPVLEWKRMSLPEEVRYRNKKTQSGTEMLRYRNKSMSNSERDLSTILFFYGTFWPETKVSFLKHINYRVHFCTFRPEIRFCLLKLSKKPYGFPQTCQLCIFVLFSQV